MENGCQRTDNGERWGDSLFFVIYSFYTGSIASIVPGSVNRLFFVEVCFIMMDLRVSRSGNCKKRNYHWIF
jgi:hypothetical protein